MQSLQFQQGKQKEGNIGKTCMLSMLKGMLVNFDLNSRLVTNMKILEQRGERPLN